MELDHSLQTGHLQSPNGLVFNHCYKKSSLLMVLIAALGYLPECKEVREAVGCLYKLVTYICLSRSLDF